MLTIILIVLLLTFVFGGVRGTGNARNIFWFLGVILAVYLVLNLVS